MGWYGKLRRSKEMPSSSLIQKRPFLGSHSFCTTIAGYSLLLQARINMASISPYNHNPPNYVGNHVWPIRSFGRESSRLASICIPSLHMLSILWKCKKNPQCLVPFLNYLESQGKTHQSYSLKSWIDVPFITVLSLYEQVQLLHSCPALSSSDNWKILSFIWLYKKKYLKFVGF